MLVFGKTIPLLPFLISYKRSKSMLFENPVRPSSGINSSGGEFLTEKLSDLLS